MSNAFFSQLNGQFIYILLSATVAIMIWIEGHILKKTEGKLPKSRLFYMASLLETTWFFISIAAVYLLSFDSIALSVPVAYGVYTIASWIYGSRLLSGTEIPDNPKDMNLSDIVIPLRYIAFSQSFALIYLLLCVFVLVSPMMTVAT